MPSASGHPVHHRLRWLAIGTAVSKFRASLMKLLGLLIAPLAFDAPRLIHQGAAQSLASGRPRLEVACPYTCSPFSRDRVRMLRSVPQLDREPSPGYAGLCSGGARRRHFLRRRDYGYHVLDYPRVSGCRGPHRPGLQRAGLPRRLLACPLLGSGGWQWIGLTLHSPMRFEKWVA